jgi:hypothetical protein
VEAFGGFTLGSEPKETIKYNEKSYFNVRKE